MLHPPVTLHNISVTVHFNRALKIIILTSHTHPFDCCSTCTILSICNLVISVRGGATVLKGRGYNFARSARETFFRTPTFAYQGHEAEHCTVFIIVIICLPAACIAIAVFVECWRCRHSECHANYEAWNGGRFCPQNWMPLRHDSP